MNRARKITDLLYGCEKMAALLAFAVMTLVIIADVLSRKFLGSGLAGAPRIAVYAMIIGAFISFGLASHRGRHLRPRFADNWLPIRWQGGIIRLQEGLTAVFCMIFAVVAIEVVYETYLLQETSRMLRIAIWPLQSVMPLAFLMAALRHMLYALYPEIRPKEGGASHASGGAQVAGGGSPPNQTKEGGASHASGGSSNSERVASDSSPHQTKEGGASHASGGAQVAGGGSPPNQTKEGGL